MTHILNGTRHEITRGGAYLLTPNDSHSLSAESDAELINIRFNDSLLPAEVSEYLQTVCRDISCELDSSSFEELLGKIGELEAEISSSGLLGTVSKSSILSQIIIKILRSADAPTQSETPHLIQKAASYVLKNFRSDLSLRRTAEHCSVTPNYLGVQFKRHTGKSFNHYLNATRLKYACSLLVSTDLSVKEIAFLSGYNSVEYFLSVFEKQLHISHRVSQTQRKL